MTFREKLADWISGGVLSGYIDEAKVSSDFGQMMARKYTAIAEHSLQRGDALRTILAATQHGKSGTAQKIARIAREALE